MWELASRNGLTAVDLLDLKSALTRLEPRTRTDSRGYRITVETRFQLRRQEKRALAQRLMAEGCDDHRRWRDQLGISRTTWWRIRGEYEQAQNGGETPPSEPSLQAGKPVSNRRTRPVGHTGRHRNPGTASTRQPRSGSCSSARSRRGRCSSTGSWSVADSSPSATRCSLTSTISRSTGPRSARTCSRHPFYAWAPSVEPLQGLYVRNGGQSPLAEASVDTGSRVSKREDPTRSPQRRQLALPEVAA